MKKKLFALSLALALFCSFSVPVSADVAGGWGLVIAANIITPVLCIAIIILGVAFLVRLIKNRKK